MNSLEIIPPPRSTLEMMKQVEEKPEEVRKAEARTAELETINPTGEFECVTAELPVQLVEPWAISNVFGEGNRAQYGPKKSLIQPVTTPEDLLKGDKMKEVKKGEVSVDVTPSKKKKKLKKTFKQRALEAAAFTGGVILGAVIINIYNEQKMTTRAVWDLTQAVKGLEPALEALIQK